MTREMTIREDGAIEAANRPGLLANAEASDFELPVLHLFQDVGRESEQYGEHKKGTWVNSMTQELVDTSTVIPVLPIKEIIVWHHRDSMSDGIAAKFTARADMNAEYLEGDGTLFDVRDSISWILLVDSLPGMPFIVRHSMTALRSARALLTMEASRHASDKPLGIYELSSREMSNEKGKWHVPQYRPTGDATDSQAESAFTYHKMLYNSTAPIRGHLEDTGGQLPI